MAYVELLGLPGCGKSTVAANMAQREGFVGVDDLVGRRANRLGERSRYLLRILRMTQRNLGRRHFGPDIDDLAGYYARNPQSWSTIWGLIAQVTDERERERVAGHFMRTFAELDLWLREGRQEESFVHHEGRQQRRVSLALRGVELKDGIIAGAQITDVTIHLVVPMDVARRRLRARGSSRNDLESVSDAIGETVATTHRRIVSIDATQPVRAVCDAIQAATA